MRLNFDALIVLDAIDRGGSFSAAAEALHRVPSAITYTVQKLEDDLGVQLFDRSGHRAQLTDAGRELLREGRRLLGAAEEIEARVKRVATGFEVELRIAVDEIIPLERLYPLFGTFYSECFGTRLRVLSEVFGGTWDALVSGRADLAIGAPGEGPPGGGYSVDALGTVPFVFVVAPDHPLAALPEPLTPEQIIEYRAVAAADSSRSLPPRTSGLLSGQDVFTLPSLRAKLEAQALGLGIGHLPVHMALPAVKDGRLVVKRVLEPQADAQLSIAWRTNHAGNALKWFRARLEDPALRASLLA
ncbi:MAG: LysR substrate-binding domain-containing protein [Chromatiales bacterium]|nr:LysR substrate-binding domain-containing protein [Chromatiales bacterium]